MVRIKSNRDYHERRIKSAVNASLLELDRQLRLTIATPSYWDGFDESVTRRKNGTIVVGGFRNIIDTGELASSQTTEINNGSMVVEWSSSTTPISGVFFGHRTKSGYVEGRDWISKTLYENWDFGSYLVAQLSK